MKVDKLKLMSASPRQNRFRQWALVIGVFLFACSASGWLIWGAQQEQLREARTRAAELANDQAQALQRGIERSLSASYALAALVRRGQGDVPDFEAIATEMLPFYPGVTVLGLAPGGIVKDVVPLAGNEQLIGFNQLGDAAQALEASKARDSGKLTLAGPLNLVQGGLGVVGRLPIFLKDNRGDPRFWGFSFVTLRFPQALEAANLGLIHERGYAYELWRNVPESGGRQVIDASQSDALASPVNAVLELPNGKWTLSVSPLAGWHATQDTGFQMGAAVVFSLLMAYVAWLAFEMKLRDQRLETEVAERTAEISGRQAPPGGHHGGHSRCLV